MPEIVCFWFFSQQNKKFIKKRNNLAFKIQRWTCFVVELSFLNEYNLFNIQFVDNLKITLDNSEIYFERLFYCLDFLIDLNPGQIYFATIKESHNFLIS